MSLDQGHLGFSLLSLPRALVAFSLPFSQIEAPNVPVPSELPSRAWQEVTVNEWELVVI